MARILIVEDDADIAGPLEDDLRLEGYEVAAVGDGEEALERLERESFDLLVLDVMLPGRDGFEICRRLRRRGSQMPIILLTAKSTEAEKVMGLDLGADDYVTKPFSPRELRARIRAVLRRTDEAPGVLHFADFEADPERFLLSRSGEPVETTPLEFKLLTTLLRHRGRVLTRRQLLDLVWGRDTYVTERVVDTHVANLRKKIERDPAAPRYLLSVHGVGYRFAAPQERGPS